jgi:CubicO group peptidase (beta-lactamase class C family)
VAVAGERKKGSGVMVTVDDRFHLGSDTKAMTATLIAILVEKKLLSWDLTLEKAFPELAGKMTADYRGVTLEQLLRHRAGLPGNLREAALIPEKLEIRKQRQELVTRALTGKPAAKPGTKFLYSNVGYVVAGAMAERAAGAPWEDLMRKDLFGPLKMTTAGFGAPATEGKIDQPWGHTTLGDPIDPDPLADNPPVIGPAGRVHCSLGDWAKFVADQLNGAAGKDGLLPAAAYRKLLEPAAPGEDYTAGGWAVEKKPYGRALRHDGDNTMNHAAALLVPGADLAVLVVCNQGGIRGKPAEKATHEVLDALLAKLLK